MKKFMQLSLFAGALLLGTQASAQTERPATEKKGEHPVCPAKSKGTEKQSKSSPPATPERRVMKTSNYRMAEPAKNQPLSK